jgi:tetratricopeptide (TPR) repeat protein
MICGGMQTDQLPHQKPLLSSTRFKIWLLALGALTLWWAAVPPNVLADVIYLKNGRKIVAEVSRQDSEQVVFNRGGGEFAIPRALVDHIEKSPQPSSEPPPGETDVAPHPEIDLPLPPPTDEPGLDALSPVVKDGALDPAYLQQLDSEVLRDPSVENRHRLAQGYQEAAIFLTRKGDPRGAIEQYRHALKFAPDDLALTLALGYLLVKQNLHNEAIELLLPASTRHADSPDIPMLLGSAYYATERMDQAIVEWKKALTLQDNPRLREALARAEQERSVAGSYQELRSQHFLLRYDGQGVRPLGEAVLKTLEGDFRDLVLDLDFYPREAIVVLLYPDQAFQDVTRSPSWVGALNDGKIRVPVSGLSSMTADLARVLRHELTHSFVRQITLGRCPTWFNEGLAQLEEGATTAGLGAQLARALLRDRLPPFAALEVSFMNLPADQVGLVYAKSLAALEYLRDTYGVGEIRRLLRLLPSNPDFNSLLQDEIRLSYPDFDREVANYIVKRYGA